LARQGLRIARLCVQVLAALAGVVPAVSAVAGPAAAAVGAPVPAAPAVPAPVASVRPGSLPLTWNTGGPKCMEMPEWQVHEYNPDLYILRQSGCTDFEKPFIYLLFGADRVLLLDTGSRRGNLAPALKLTVHRWLTRNRRDGMPMVVVHTHAHSDHTAGDAELLAMADPDIPLTVIAATVSANREFFHMTDWPTSLGGVDLGFRLIDAIAIPGHEPSAVALYDRQTGILFTGDNVYPGRLYIHDLAEYQASNERLLSFTADKPVAHLLGNHIEQTRTPFVDYPVGTLYQPDEHELALSRAVLLEIAAGLAEMHGTPRRVAYRDYSLWPVGPSFRDTEEGKALFERTQRQQLDHMWDQTQP
jgi:glyoxylase-like metal-dependent hydrolase (beta-lactamase superfamily II)